MSTVPSSTVRARQAVDLVRFGPPARTPSRPLGTIDSQLGDLDEVPALLLDGIPRRSLVPTAATIDMITWWRQQRRGVLKFNKRSINLSSPYQHTSGGSISMMTLYDSGIAEGSVALMSSRGGSSRGTTRCEAAGFRGDPAFPKLELDCTVTSERERIEELLIWADELIRTASAGEPPESAQS